MSDPNHFNPEDNRRYTAYTTDRRAMDEHRVLIKSKKKKRRLLRSSGIIVALSILFLIIVCFFVFNIRNVIVEGNEMYSEKEIISGAGISKLSNYFFVTEKTVRSHLAESYPAIVSATVDKAFPSTIKITVEESAPFFYLTIGSRTFILDDRLVVHRAAESVQEAETLNLIQLELSGVKQCLAGKYVETEDKDVVEMFNILYEQLCKNQLIEEISYIDFSDKFDIRFIIGSEYTVKIGNILECESKID